MSDLEIPEGYVLLDPKGAYGESFGPVYLNDAARKLAFRISPQHLNPAGVCHGGAIATFADMQLLAVTPQTGAEAVHRPTISLTLDYLSPALPGDWIEAEVTLIKATKVLLFTQALITARGQSIVRSNAIYRNYPSQEASAAARRNLGIAQ